MEGALRGAPLFLLDQGFAPPPRGRRSVRSPWRFAPGDIRGRRPRSIQVCNQVSNGLATGDRRYDAPALRFVARERRREARKHVVREVGILGVARHRHRGRLQPRDVMLALRNHAVDERQILAEVIYAVHHATTHYNTTTDFAIVAAD